MSDINPRLLLHFASQKHTRIKADGTVAEWQQEDESAVTTKAEAVGMVQRTIDFWLPQMVNDIVANRGISREEATALATKHFHAASEQMVAEPFPIKWGITVDDLKFEVPDDG